MLPALIPVLIAGAVAFTVFYIRNARARARQKELEQLAQQLGMSFSAADTFGLLQQLKSFDLFRRERRWLGRAGKIKNVMRGLVGDTEVFLFDYTYVIYANNSTRRITQTVFFANNKEWYLPEFRLKPEGWSQKLLSVFDKSDINFPENPDFSKRFWLSGEFESLIRKKFSPAVQDFLCENPPAHLEGNNFYLLAYKPRKTMNADEAGAFFQHCCRMVKLFQQEGKLELLNLAELKPAPETPLEMPPLPVKKERQKGE